MFRLIKVLEKMEDQFINIKDLFYYDVDNKLILNREVSKDVSYTIEVGIGKSIHLEPCVIPNYNDGIFKEGIIFAINSYDNFSYLTYEELCYFRYVLTHLEFDTILAYLIKYCEEESPKVFKELKRTPIVVEPENINTDLFVKVKQANVIPPL